MANLYKKIGNVKKISKQEWLEARNKGIGGSDVGAILGFNPYKSAIGVYLEKVGESKPFEGNEYTKAGTDLEDYIAKRFVEESGKKIRRENNILQSVENPFMIANIDRKVLGENAILECKNYSGYKFFKDETEDTIPDTYSFQCQHYMYVTGAEKCYLAVLIRGAKFRIFEIIRNDELISDMINLLKEFWENNVLMKNIPAPQGFEEDTNNIKYMYPNSNNEKIAYFSDEKKLMELKSLKEKKSEIEAKIEQIEQEIKLVMQDSEIAESEVAKIIWKSSKRNSLDSKKLKEEHPEIYNKYIKESQTRTFKITFLSEKEISNKKLMEAI